MKNSVWTGVLSLVIFIAVAGFLVFTGVRAATAANTPSAPSAPVSALTTHQLLHANRVFIDAGDLSVGVNRSRIETESDRIISGLDDWPTFDGRPIEPIEIHDWIEEPNQGLRDIEAKR